MIKGYVFLADGFEIIEALAPVDIIRRGGIEYKTVSIMPTRRVTCNIGVPVEADLQFDEVKDFGDADLLVLPGGMPGADNLNKFEPLHKVLLKHYADGKHIGAICAAPMVLGGLGLLKGKRITCYPGFENYMVGAEITHDVVITDGKITTAEGPAAAMPFAYELMRQFTDDKEVSELEGIMRFTHLMEK